MFKINKGGVADTPEDDNFLVEKDQLYRNKMKHIEIIQQQKMMMNLAKIMKKEKQEQKDNIDSNKSTKSANSQDNKNKREIIKIEQKEQENKNKEKIKLLLKNNYIDSNKLFIEKLKTGHRERMKILDDSRTKKLLKSYK